MSSRTGDDGRQNVFLSLVAAFDELGEQLRVDSAADPFEAVVGLAVKRVRGAEAASITLLERGRLVTAAATDDRARRADMLQYELGSGPCVDAVVTDSTYAPDDLRVDQRWPEYGRRVHEEVGWTSMRSFRLNPEPAAREVIAGLNLYARPAGAFDVEATNTALLLAVHSATAVAAAVNLEQARNLQHALESSREIGVAVGILMARHKLSRAQAFDLLRVASQQRNRKLREVATEVGDGGDLTM